jgi:hypothetical protein
MNRTSAMLFSPSLLFFQQKRSFHEIHEKTRKEIKNPFFFVTFVVFVDEFLPALFAVSRTEFGQLGWAFY